MKILITGSAGTLAYSFFTNKNHKGHTLVGIDLKDSIFTHYKFNIASESNLSSKLLEIAPDIILHFAAETDVDKCEINKNISHNTNFLTTKKLVEFVKKRDIPIVLISSASIFDGSKKYPFNESSDILPVNQYGRDKLLSEQYMIENLKKYFIFRFGWLVGNPEIDQKFFGKVFTKLKNKNNVIKGVGDVFGSLSFADSFADFFYDCVIENNSWGIYHFAASGSVSRYELIKFMRNFYKMQNEIELKEISIKDFPLTTIRPLHEVISVEKLVNTFNIKVENWEISLKEYLDNYRYLLF